MGLPYLNDGKGTSGIDIDITECFEPGKIVPHNVFTDGYGQSDDNYLRRFLLIKEENYESYIFRSGWVTV